MYGYAPYESVGDKKAKALKKLEKLRKKNPDVKPVTIDGRKITKTWWGKAWSTNLESYSDYANRIGRGRSYLTHGSVLDLQIRDGLITSQVSGSGSSIYQTQITISPLKPKTWKAIKELSDQQFDSIPKLLQGDFPKGLQQVFSAKGEGLFPMPREIKFSCSCPDSARMCKHIAATLYGVGNRLDYSPELLFTLRGVDINELVEFAIESRKSDLISRAKNVKSKRLIKAKEDSLSKLFGIDFARPKPASPKRVRKASKTPTKKK